MKKWLGLVGLLFGLSALSYAGTPMENYYLGQAPLSNTTIIGSTASVASNVNLTVTVSTPTSTIGFSGGSVSCRNCFTRFVVQVPTTTVVTFQDNNTTKWTLYGVGLGASGVNTLSLPEAHLEPWCTSSGNQSSFVLTNTGGASTNPQSFSYEGYTQCGGTANAGVMQ